MNTIKERYVVKEAQATKETCLVVGIDDTDDLSKETSTGLIAQCIADALVEMGGVLHLGVTRHQLLLSDEVSYTSHNSAMVFEARLASSLVEEFCRKAMKLIADLRAASSNPGFCIARLEQLSDSPEHQAERRRLISFGIQAKSKFCHISEAFSLAEKLTWISLVSCGGNESGVVGALAGVGLRIGGNDGRFRGNIDLAAFGLPLSGERNAVPKTLTDTLCKVEKTGRKAEKTGRKVGHDTECKGVLTTVGELIYHLKSTLAAPAIVTDLEGCQLKDDFPLSINHKTKPLFRDNAMAIVCTVKNGVAYPQGDMKDLSQKEEPWANVCNDFEWDNDSEECSGEIACCRNCLYRRWMAQGFKCIKNEHMTIHDFL